MRPFRVSDADHWENDATSFAVGALAGLAIGLLVSRGLPRPRSLSVELRDRARTAARRIRPARLHRLAFEQEDLDTLEDAVLNAFLSDEVLSERGVDIGAISPGIVELSGSVESESEVQRAVALANGTAGVRTVVNRLTIERSSHVRFRRPLEPDDLTATFSHTEGRTGGMGRRRQSFVTEPDRSDDSQKRREESLAAADRDQWQEEGYANATGRADAHAPGDHGQRVDFREDELDNQDPHGKHADLTLDEQPQELNTDARVGEGPKPGLRDGISDAEAFEEPRPHDYGQ